MDRAKSLDGDDLAAAITSTNGFPGVTGTITLDEHRNPVKSAVMLVIKNGERRYAATIPPPTAPLPEVPEVEDAGAGAGPAGAQTSGAAGKLLQTVVDTLALGALYALIALGYTLVYGVLRFINFAHADVFTFGAWIAFAIARGLGFASAPSALGLPAVLVIAMVLCSALGVTIERLAYRPLRNAPRLNVLITAIGVSLFLQNVGQLKWFFGTQPQRMPSLIEDRVLARFAGVQMHLVDVIGVVTALALMLVLDWLIFRTRIGRAMRAVSHDCDVAALMGINVDAVISFTFVLGSSLAAAAGFLYAMKYPGLNQPAHATWVLLGLKAFVAAVIGGIGDIRGAMLGGILIGFIELFGAAYLSPHLRDIYVFSILILVLLVRPSGILGKAVAEKV